jgi:N6-adenosine-specific RNA methylase IME4
MKCNVIVADPPWQFSDKLTMSDVKRGAEANYRGVLDLTAICELPVKRVAADNALLALWCPSSMIADGLEVMRAWGFEQKQIYTWLKGGPEKLAFGMGRYFRGCTEHALIGVRGKMASNVSSKSERNAELSPALPHSKKPETLQDRLERMFPQPHYSYLELFARRARPGWLCVGNEAPGFEGVDIRDWFTTQEEQAA